MMIDTIIAELERDPVCLVMMVIDVLILYH